MFFKHTYLVYVLFPGSGKGYQRRGGISPCLEAALKILLPLTPPAPSDWQSHNRSIQGWEKMQWNAWANVQGLTLRGKSSLNSWNPHVMKQSWRVTSGEGTGTLLWGFLIIRIGVRLLLGWSDCWGLSWWESKGTWNVSESIIHQHISPSAQNDFCKAGGEVRYFSTWCLVLPNFWSWGMRVHSAFPSQDKLSPTQVKHWWQSGLGGTSHRLKAAEGSAFCSRTCLEARGWWRVLVRCCSLSPWFIRCTVRWLG